MTRTDCEDCGRGGAVYDPLHEAILCGSCTGARNAAAYDELGNARIGLVLAIIGCAIALLGGLAAATSVVHGDLERLHRDSTRICEPYTSGVGSSADTDCRSDEVKAS